MSKAVFTFLTIFLLSLLVAACGGRGSTDSASAQTGANLSPAEALFQKSGCIACHALEAGVGDPNLGPAMAGLAARSAERIQTAAYTGNADTVEAYIREAILNPQLDLVEGYEPIMPNTYQISLSEDEITTLVNFLMTEK